LKIKEVKGRSTERTPLNTKMSPKNINKNCRVIKGSEKKVKKLKVAEVFTNFQKKVFQVTLTNETQHTVAYTDKELENTLGYDSFDAGGLKMVKETNNQCVLASVINSVAFLMRSDKNLENIVDKLSSHFLNDEIMKKRAKEYPKEHRDKMIGVKGGVDKGWHQYDLRNIIRADCNEILSKFNVSIRFSKNLSRVLSKNCKFLKSHPDRRNKAYILMGYHGNKSVRDTHRKNLQALQFVNFSYSLRCNFEALYHKGLGQAHAVALVFDNDGNGAIGDPSSSKSKEFKILKPETYIDCCSGVFGCYEVTLH
jgi:hypothetical protein